MRIEAALSALFALASCALLVVPGCGGNECDKATEFASDCLGISSGGSASSTTECTGSSACSAACINAVDCDTLKDSAGIGDGAPSSKSQGLRDCLAKCATAP